MKGVEIRTRFLQYFKERGHEVVASSSLVPVNDPTLLFANAGMNQFKEVFLGLEKRQYDRAVTSQKCVRAGGKHNDLENVGYTARHHTFFEMLGNFSFGDYFKRDAIIYAWDFLTRVMGLPSDKLYATIYKDDDEAAGLWRTVIGLEPERIIRLGEKDNFWSMGDTGPCGPCSEIVIDRGPGFSCGALDCGIETCGCDRWLELWNLVFMQFNRDSDGKMTPLPRPSIDTGMGLERITAVVQDAPTNFDTDLFLPIIELVERLSGKMCTSKDVPKFPFRIIADHGRACTFLVTDGVMPSNEGRGYVLRRVLRRAVRYGKTLGIEEPFMHQIVPVVGKIMGDAYPDLLAKADLCMRVIRLEEARFMETLAEGTRKVGDLVDTAGVKGQTVISGKEAFLLYDTYGFPIDLTEDMAQEAGLKVDRREFEQAMEEQRRRARAARHVEGPAAIAALAAEIRDVAPTEFVGYERLEEQAKVLALLVDGERAGYVQEGLSCGVITDRTPFYGESGGQAGDVGYIASGENLCAIERTHHLTDGRVLHSGHVKKGAIAEGDQVKMSVASTTRSRTMRNHGATHLLHKALRIVLGEHVNQAGSLVLPERLRFDFTHFLPLSQEELMRVEDIANTRVLDCLPVHVEEMAMDEARARGATALFGEKYGARVRVVSMGDYSMELCGGTHVRNTGEIGLIKITSESSIGSGLRRIEAVTGTGAILYLRDLEGLCAGLSSLLKTSPADVLSKAQEIVQKNKDQARQIESLRGEVSKFQAESLARDAQDEKGVKIVATLVDLPDVESMRLLGDMIRDRLGNGAVVLASLFDDKVTVVVMASKEATARGVHAGKIAREAALPIGGNGGGRPDLAQAGGRDVSRARDALAAATRAFRAMVS